MIIAADITSMTFHPQLGSATNRAVFACSLCSKIAGVVEILPTGHPYGLAKDSSTICISGFIGEERVVLTESAHLALQICLAAADAAGLYNLEHLWAPFYCPTCARIYCVEHWTVVPEYDEEFFDHSHGYCPEGHRRLIED